MTSRSGVDSLPTGAEKDFPREASRILEEGGALMSRSALGSYLLYITSVVLYIYNTVRRAGPA